MRPQDVAAFVFWTRNARPFFPNVQRLEEAGYRFYFHWTLNNFPPVLETGNPGTRQVIDSMHVLASKISARRIIWRYDPVLFSNQMPPRWHLENFQFLAENIRGASRKCIFSFVDYYKKMEKALASLRKKGITHFNLDYPEKMEFLSKISSIASANEIQLAACCEDECLSPGHVEKARCIDGQLLRNIYPDFDSTLKKQPTRQQCGCAASVDIGAYDSCLFGCLYCYANRNFNRSRDRYRRHDPENPRLIPSSIKNHTR